MRPRLTLTIGVALLVTLSVGWLFFRYGGLSESLATGVVRSVSEISRLKRFSPETSVWAAPSSNEAPSPNVAATGDIKVTEASTIRIEPGGSSTTGTCPDCGSQSRYVSGFVYRNNNAHAVYYAGWTDNHPERGIRLLLSIGRWGDGTTGKMRRRVGVDCRMGPDRPSFMIVDAADMPWNDEKLLGAAMTRAQVLSDPIRSDAFQILDHLVAEDRRIKSFLVGGQHH